MDNIRVRNIKVYARMTREFPEFSWTIWSCESGGVFIRFSGWPTVGARMVPPTAGIPVSLEKLKAHFASVDAGGPGTLTFDNPELQDDVLWVLKQRKKMKRRARSSSGSDAQTARSRVWF